MNDTVQIPFHEKRRQHFLSEESWNNKFQDYFSGIEFWKSKWASNKILSMFTFRLKVDDIWCFIRLNYTAGEPVSILPPMLDEIMDVLRITTTHWKMYKNKLRKEGYYCGPLKWNDADDYLKALQLIALCYLLHREDLLPQLLQIILDNAADDLEPDSTIEDFFYYRFKDRPDPDYIQMGDHAVLISDAIREKDPNEKKALLHQYLKDWYKEMVGMSDLEYNSHLDPEQNGYCGYWAFEVAAIAYLDDVDDTEFYQYPYYPKGMVEWAREQRRIRYAR